MTNKVINLTIPAKLFQRLKESRCRGESSTDAEAVRATIKYALDNDTIFEPESQEKNPEFSKAG